MENDNILIETINGLLLKTEENKIPWMLVNPNALRWTKQAAPGSGVVIVTIQKQPQPQPTNTNYILTIQAHGAPQVTQINSLNYVSLKEPLGRLFQEAYKVASSVSIRILKNLLDGL